MDPEIIIAAVVAVLSAIGAILAWFAKLRWSREFTIATNKRFAAKDAEIQLLERHVQHLQDLTPMKALEYAKSYGDLLDTANDRLGKLSSENQNLAAKILSLEAELRQIHTKTPA